ncbi:MAG: DUF262 domain-containing HNH endonuclease family protein [Thermoflexibacter sp.]|nr:DUF262 domain-containing HNH endonuclease family protein [Thermoflexibacter sp.]
MKASETKLQKILEGTNQYVVPLFQRAYSWDKKEWSDLWKDINELCESEGENRRTHFLGSMVTMPTVSVPEGVAKYLLIDGQQRYTTVLILLIAMRNIAKRNGEEKLSDEITNRFLVNQYEEGLDYYKLQPTQIDRPTFYNLIANEEVNSDNQISKAYYFFERKLISSKLDFQVLKQVITSYLSVVSIVLDVDDDPHLVFESLNATGRKLTESDLIRNYFFMRIDTKEHDSIHAKYWAPMEKDLGAKLQDCVRHYLIKDEGFVKESEIYFKLKEIISKTKADEKLKELAKFSRYYIKLLKPEQEPNKKLSSAIYRLNQLQVTTSYPFLLNCYEEYSNGILSIEDFLEIFKLVENFMIRRIICNIKSNQLNKIFPELYKQAKKISPNDLKEGVRKVLQEKDYPRDIDFKRNLFENKLYGAGEKLTRTKFILATIEESFNHKEQTDLVNCTIEHIMPQTLTSWWENHLGEHYEYIHEMFLDTIGNLTLTKYNSELSNKPFTNKKEMFEESKIGLNSYFKDFEVDSWTNNEIKQRAEWLVDKSLNIWAYFGDKNIDIPVSFIDSEGYTFETMNNGEYLEGNNLEMFELLQTKIFHIDNNIKEDIQKQTIEYKLNRSKAVYQSHFFRIRGQRKFMPRCFQSWALGSR